MHKQITDDDMHNLQFTQEGGDNPATLSLWINKDNKLYIQMDENDYDNPYAFQYIVLDLEDAKMLEKELARLAREMATNESDEPEWLKKEKQQKQLRIATS